MDKHPFAVVGLFDTPGALLEAVAALRRKGISGLEAYTPYPVHGLEEALGQERSPLGWMVLAMGIAGAALALLLQWWTSAVDYAIPTGGKAIFSWQAFVPIVFELTVLFATFTAGLGMLLLLNRLPFFGHPLLHSRAIGTITRDRFALAVESWDGTLDAAAAEAALREAGAASTERVPFPVYEAWSPRLWLRTGAAIALSCLLAGAGLCAAIKLLPVLPPMVAMHDQPKLGAFRSSALFRDGHGMQLPVPGTVARGHLPFPFATPEAASALGNPLPRTAATLQKGRRLFDDHCAVCHGAVGDGVPTLSSAYGAKPANLHGAAIKGYSDGRLYGVIVLGKNSMPSYAADLSEEERWEVVHYLRALQRARDARDGDLP